MRHGKKFNKLGRTASHRKQMLSNMAASLITHKRINTTVPKAKSLRKYVEPLITRSKTDDTHSRRVVFRYLQDKDAVNELFREVAPKVGDRPGGYVRIIRLGSRQGDNAEMCMMELVDFNELMLAEKEEKQKSGSGKRRRRRGGGKKKKSASDEGAQASQASAESGSAETETATAESESAEATEEAGTSTAEEEQDAGTSASEQKKEEEGTKSASESESAEGADEEEKKEEGSGGDSESEEGDDKKDSSS